MSVSEKKSGNGRQKIETTKMSSRGQIVIPQDIRDRLQANEGTIFVVAGTEDTLILRKLTAPTEDSLLKDIEKINGSAKKRSER